MCTNPPIFLTHYLADKKGNSRRVKLQLHLQVTVYLPHLLMPLFIIGIRFTLMQQDSLNNTILYRQLRHIKQSFVRITSILIQDTVHPVTLLLSNQSGILILVKESDRTTLNSYRDDTDTHILWDNIQQCTSEIVYGTQMGIMTTEGRSARLATKARTASGIFVRWLPVTMSVSSRAR